MKTIEMLINEIKASEDLQKLLAEAVKNNALADFIKEQGCEATAAEFIDATKAQSGEVDEATLGAVAGGANAKEAWISILSLGICCAIEAINSAMSDVEDYGDGRILCTES